MSDETTVAVVQGDVPGDGDDILLDHRQVTQNHVDATTRLADDVAAGDAAGARLRALAGELHRRRPVRGRARSTPTSSRPSEAIGVPILVGAMVDAGPEHVLNQGIVWDPDTGAGDRYTKRHPVPFGEYIPWRSVFRDNFGRLGADPARHDRRAPAPSRCEVAGIAVADAICFDVAYDDGIHAQVRDGAELLVVQTANAMFIHTGQIDQQFAITRLRALETGRYVLVGAPPTASPG